MIGWDVSYRAEFAPTATESHHTIPEKTKKLLSVEQTIRGTFNCQEPGKLLLCINNNSASKKEKRVLYRFKVKVPDVVLAEHALNIVDNRSLCSTNHGHPLLLERFQC